MKTKRLHLSAFLASLLLILTGCMREELPVAAHERGNVRETSVSMGNNYETQLFFDLETDSIVFQVARMDWDLAFECAADGWRIRMNTARLMLASHTGTADWASVRSASGLKFHWDTPDGNPDSLAIGDWRSDTSEVIVLDLGYAPDGNRLGYRKIQFLKLENGTYTFRYANMNGTNEYTASIAKDDAFHYVHYSIRNHQPVIAEPLIGTYDLVFTQYTYIFYEVDNTPYLVNGVLLNAAGVEVALDTVKSFEEITAEDIPNYTFSTNWDAVGFGWKDYDFDNQRYIVYPEKNYVIRDRNGFYWKLHFTDFYDQTGQKGTPSFSYQKL